MTKADLKRAKLPWKHRIVVGAAVYGTVVCSPALITYAVWKRRKNSPE